MHQVLDRNEPSNDAELLILIDREVGMFSQSGASRQKDRGDRQEVWNAGARGRRAPPGKEATCSTVGLSLNKYESRAVWFSGLTRIRRSLLSSLI